MKKILFLFLSLIAIVGIFYFYSTKSNVLYSFLESHQQSALDSSHQKSISSAPQVHISKVDADKQKQKFLGGTVLANTSYGSSETELGLQKTGQPLGPSDLFLDRNGQPYILDSVNRRIMVVDEESGLKIVFSYPDEVNFQSLLKHPDGYFLLLDNDGKQLIKYDEKGIKLDPIPIQVKKGDYIRSLKTDHQGKIYAIGGKSIYGFNGQSWDILPGQPFFQDSEHFIKPIKKGPDQYEINILDQKNQIEKTIKIEGPFDMVEDIFTDQKNRIYIVFSRVVQNPKPDVNGVYQALVNQIFVDVYSFEGNRINTIPLKREDYAEHERAIYIDSSGNLVRFVSDKNNIKILKHNFDHSNVKYEDPTAAE